MNHPDVTETGRRLSSWDETVSMPFSWPSLTETHIRCHQPGKAQDVFPLFNAEECSSSMDLAWQLFANDQFPVWSSILVARQNQGRGQFRRKWRSPEGNLYGSLRLPLPPEEWRPLTPLLIAGSIHGILVSLGVSAELKWPNDILVYRKKVGGILIEQRSETLIVGIGLNLVSAPSMDELPEHAAIQAGFLGEFGIFLSPLDLWTQIVQAIYRDLPEQSSGKRVTNYVKQFENHMAFIGENVVFDTHDEKDLPAIVLGLDNKGGIRLKTADGERTLYSGRVTSRIC